MTTEKKTKSKTVLPAETSVTYVESKIDVEGLLESSVLAMVRAGGVLPKALRELIHNAIDAGATQYQITSGVFNAQPALFVSDNGSGFENFDEIKSALSHGFSSKKEKKDAIGQHGLGIKSTLALNRDMKKPKVTIISVSATFHQGVSFGFDFDQLVSSVPEGTKQPVLEYSKIPAIWINSWLPLPFRRKYGTTIVITGFEPRYSANLRKVAMSDLGEYLTPLAASMGTVFDDAEPISIEPKLFSGKRYVFEDTKTFTKLGAVRAEIYYDASGDGVMLCGDKYTVMPILDAQQFVMNGLRDARKNTGEKSTVDYRSGAMRAWQYVEGGYVIVENMRDFRSKANQLNEHFLNSGAAEELEMFLFVLGSELQKLSTQAKEDADTQLRAQYLTELIVELQQSADDEEIVTAMQGVAKMTEQTKSNAKLDIRPTSIQVYTGSKTSIELSNFGAEDIYFGDAQWKVVGGYVSIVGQAKGKSITIEAGKTPGQTKLNVIGRFGVHEINVRVSLPNTEPYISGQNTIVSGMRSRYTLLRHNADEVEYEIKGKTRIVLTDGLSVVLEASAKGENCTLVATDKNGQVIATKRIAIVDEATKPSVTKKPIVRIGKGLYLLEQDWIENDLVAKMDIITENQSIPTILVNTMHPDLKMVSKSRCLEIMLTNVVAVATHHQVEQGQLRARDALMVWNEVRRSVLGRIFAKESAATDGKSAKQKQKSMNK